MNVLVDTSVWSLALRRKPEDLGSAEKAIVAELRELIREGRARSFGLVRQELLSGIKTGEQFDKLKNVLRSFPQTNQLRLRITKQRRRPVTLAGPRE